MTQHQETDTDDLYLNDFHREWNERCMQERRRTASMCFSPEYLRAAAQRMKEMVRQQEKKDRLLRKERKKR